MSQKIYAVKKGITPGIYNTWEECKAMVNGFSGAEYKSFKNINDAYNYMNDKNATSDSVPESDAEHAIAYVDGSFNIKTNMFSYGIVLFYNGKELHFSQKFDDPKLASMRNVAGEIYGAWEAMKYAISNSIPSLIIYHDYEGIAKWCEGSWKTNKETTIAYKQYYDSIKDKIHIEFRKVKGHSGDKYNDLADELAKSAIF
ncbi:MAG: viroplasmin family protein [Eubacterium sp.]